VLFISSQLSKPKRIQGVYVLSKEVKRVVSFYKKEDFVDEKEKQEKLGESLERKLEEEPIASSNIPVREQDSLYEEAKQIVIESKKASASLLQRRLSIGYARAAIGPGDGAKPRKVYVQEPGAKDEDGWEKV